MIYIRLYYQRYRISVIVRNIMGVLYTTRNGKNKNLQTFNLVYVYTYIEFKDKNEM